jgi:hypothetical protein
LGVLVEGRHVGHPILVAVAGEPDRCATRRWVQQHIPHARAEQVLRQVEVVERTPYKDPGCAKARRQRPAPLDHQHVQAPLRKQAPGVQASEARTHHDNVYFPHIRRRYGRCPATATDCTLPARYLYILTTQDGRLGR